MKALPPESLRDSPASLKEIGGFRRREGSEGDLNPKVLREATPTLSVPVSAFGDGEAVGGAVLVEEAPKELLRASLIEFLENFRGAERFP